MDFYKLSQETIDLSEKMGPRQQQLLFDSNYYSEDVSLPGRDLVGFSEESEDSAGILYFIDKGKGSYCIRGIPCESFNNESDQQQFVNQNKHFEKADDLLFFPCPRIESAQMICDQIMNRRYPFIEESLCNISDPGPGWWLDHTENSISVYFKLMGNKGRPLENVGPIGDPEVAKVRWVQAASFFRSVFSDVEFSQSEKGLFLKLNNENKILGRSYFEDLISLFSEGENNFSFADFQMSLQAQTLHLYLSEIALTRKFWIHVSSLI